MSEDTGPRQPTGNSLDFTRFNQSALEQALRNINRDKYPENYAACVAEIARRKVAGEWQEPRPAEMVGSSAPLEETKSLRQGFPLWNRLWANCIDGLVIAGLCIPLYYWEGNEGQWWITCLMGLITFTYDVICESSICGGQTLGYRALGLRLVTDEGQLLSVRRAVLRAVLYYVLSWLSSLLESVLPGSFTLAAVGYLMTGLFIFNFLLAFFHPQRRTLVDLFTNSLMIYRERTPFAKPAEWVPRASAFAFVGALAFTLVFALMPADINLTDEQKDIARKIQEDTGATAVTFGTFSVNKDAEPLLTVTGPRERFGPDQADKNFEKIERILQGAAWEKEKPKVRIVITGINGVSFVNMKHSEIREWSRPSN